MKDCVATTMPDKAGMDRCYPDHFVPVPRREESVRDYQNRRLESEKFWNDRFERYGIFGVGPRWFANQYGKKLRAGDAKAWKIWDENEELLFSNTDILLKDMLYGQRRPVYFFEPGCGPAELTKRCAPEIIDLGWEYFACDISHWSVETAIERMKLAKPGVDWSWRIQQADVQDMDKLLERFKPPQGYLVIVVLGRLVLHLTDDEVFEKFMRQVGQIAEEVLFFEPVLDELVKLKKKRKQNPGTKYRSIKDIENVLGMKVWQSRKCKNFGDPYFIGRLTH